MTRALIDLDAIGHNTRLLAHAAAGAGLMAVVKADGFGHGAVPVAEATLAHGASWLGVTSLSEALELRSAGITAPILMWLYAPFQTMDEALLADVDVSASSIAALEALGRAAKRTGRPASVHLKADTGLSRGGATETEWGGVIETAVRLRSAGLIEIRAVWSHLANAEDPSDPGLHRQMETFRRIRAEARSADVDPALVHLANSAAALQVPAAHFDLVRPGIAIYGVEPVPGRVFGLRPAMTLESTVILTKRVGPGTGVSYGPEHVTDRDTTLALVPAGYADGVPRRTGGRGWVSIGGVRCPIVGRVAMDQVVVDAGDHPVVAGDRVVIFGSGESGEPTVAEWAGWAETNPHEILTGIGSRVPRIHYSVDSPQKASADDPSPPVAYAEMTSPPHRPSR